MDSENVSAPTSADSRLWTRDFILLSLGLSCISFTNYAASTVMAFYVAQISGSLAYSGIAGGAFFITSLVLRPVSGMAVDRIGTRWILVASTLLCIGACTMQAMAGSIAFLVVCRVLHGAGFCFYTTAGNTAAANVVPLARRSEGLGYYMLGNVVAMAIGPAIALAIVGEQTLADFRTWFLISAAVCLLAFLMVFAVGDSGRRDRAPQGTGAAPRPPQAGLPPTFLGFEAGVLWPCCIGLLLSIGYAAMVLYLPAYGRDSGWGNVGVFFGLYAALMMVSRLMAGRIADRHGADVVMFPAFLLGMAAYVLIASAHAPWMLLAAAVPLGLSSGMAFPQISTFCISRSSRERRGTAAAAYYLSVDAGVALGMPLTGGIVALSGYRATYLFCAAGVVAAMLLYACTLSDLRFRHRR
jgi:MFS family permease